MLHDTPSQRLPRGESSASTRGVDEQDLRGMLARWFEAGDQAAMRAAFDALWARLPRPPDLCRRLGRDEVEGVLLDELEILLRRETGALRDARDPLAFVVKHTKHRLLDRLRKERRRQSKAPMVTLDPGAEAWRVPSVPPDSESLDLRRALEAALRAMTIDRRVAFLLRNAPDRISDADWTMVAKRHPPPPPLRPPAPLGDEEGARLLNPVASVDAYRKNLQRAMDDLAAAAAEGETR